MSGAYYNDSDPFCAAWLRELIKVDLIAPGEVDERSIEEVKPDDLRGFTQCHFFAGIGVWSYALRLAGWPDSRPVWTGSCPCPSFSAAGQGKGFEDPRHLWPCWFGLIRESRPPTIFGEQADKAIGFGWLDLVQTDLEAEGYAVGATVFGAHSVGAPHIRQRLYFVADSSGERIRTAGLGSVDEAAAGMQGTDGERQRIRADVGQHGDAGERSDSDGGNPGAERLQRSRQHGLLAEDSQPSERGNADDIGRQQLAAQESRERTGAGERRNEFSNASLSRDGNDSDRARPFTRQQASEGMGYGSTVEPTGGAGDGINTEQSRLEGFGGHVRDWRGPGWLDPITARSVAAAGATRGYWSDCDWWYGRDGKYRPIGAGLFPLVAGATGRMGKLRGYGNAICAPQAQAFIEAYMSI